MRHSQATLPTESGYTDHLAADRRRIETRLWLRAREADVAERHRLDRRKPRPSTEVRP